VIFSAVELASPQFMLMREQRHIRGSEETTRSSRFSGSPVGTEPMEVLGTEQALDLSALEWQESLLNAAR